MKKLSLFLAVLLLSLPAYAGWDLRQDENGGTYWVDRDDGYEAHVSEGRVTLTITDISTAASDFVVMPVKGTIEKIYSVIHGNITSAGAAKLTFYYGDGLGAFVEVSNTTSPLTIAASSTAGTVDTFTPTTDNVVAKGGVLNVRTDGGSTGTVEGTVTIIINPK